MLSRKNIYFGKRILDGGFNLKDDFVILVLNFLNFFDDCFNCFYFCLIKIIERENYIFLILIFIRN